MNLTPENRFRRDRFTWLTYLMLPYYAYLQANIGPMMPFLRDELRLNYTIASLHFGAFALGMMIVGLTAERTARRVGRYRVFWAGGLGMALSAILFMLGHHAAITIGSSFLMSVTGSHLLIMLQSSLSDHHGENRAQALTEMNTAAAIGSGIAPLMVGTLERIGLGWRMAMLVGGLYWVTVWLGFRRVKIAPARQSAEVSPEKINPTREKLPLIFWAYWVVLFLSVSIEWCLISWGADFLVNKVKLSRVNASLMMTVFFVAFVLGRWTFSQLTRRVSLSRLYILSYTIVLIGFLPFWLAPLPALNVFGLAIAGFGAANLFPMGLAIVSGVVKPEQSDAASGRVALAAGTAILVAPQILGSLADQVGIAKAYGVEVLLILLAVSVMLWANRLAVRVAQPA